jgi:lipopolysaccharide export system protein LptA
MTKTLFFLLFFAFSATAQAFSLTTDLPLTIQAGQASIDDNKGITVYRDNVEVRQGNMEMYADTLTLTYEEKDGERELTLVTAEGSPARFNQTRDDGIETKAKASRMEYYLQQNLLHLINNAEVLQGQDSFSGEYMVYDAKRNILTAKGGKEERVTVTLQPKKNKTPSTDTAE